MGFTYQEILGAVGFIIGLSGSFVYIRSIFRHETKPHLFTWLTWGIISCIGFLAQLHDHAGPGSWALSITALSCLSIAALSLKYGEKNITLSDKISLAFSLSAILPWLLTKDPLGSVIMAAIIDCVAFYPTIRKSWNKPGEENLESYYLANIKFALALMAMENFTLNTTLYISAVFLANSAFIIMCHIRRKTLARQVVANG